MELCLLTPIRFEDTIQWKASLTPRGLNGKAASTLAGVAVFPLFFKFHSCRLKLLYHPLLYVFGHKKSHAGKSSDPRTTAFVAYSTIVEKIYVLTLAQLHGALNQ